MNHYFHLVMLLFYDPDPILTVLGEFNCDNNDTNWRETIHGQLCGLAGTPPTILLEASFGGYRGFDIPQGTSECKIMMC